MDPASVGLKAGGTLFAFIGAAMVWSAKHVPKSYYHDAFFGLFACAMLTAESFRRSRDFRWFFRVAIFTLFPVYCTAAVGAHYGHKTKTLNAGLGMLSFGSLVTLLGSCDLPSAGGRIASGMNSTGPVAKLLVAVSGLLTFLGSAILWANASKIKNGSDTGGIEYASWMVLGTMVAAVYARAGKHARIIALVMSVLYLITAMDVAVIDHEKKNLAKAGSVMIWLAMLTNSANLLFVDADQDEDSFDDMNGPPAFAGAQHVPDQGPAPPQQGGQPNPYLSM